jgi:hypothetical protein
MNDELGIVQHDKNVWVVRLINDGCEIGTGTSISLGENKKFLNNYTMTTETGSNNSKQCVVV